MRENRNGNDRLNRYALAMDTASLVIYAGRTAAHRLLHSNDRLRMLSKAEANRCLSNAGSSVDFLGLSDTDFGSPPYEILVPTMRCHRNSHHAHHHTCSSELPAGSLMRIGKSEFICSPAYTFCQMSRTSSLAQTCELGTNLCASYWIDWLETIRPREQPIATSAGIRRFASENKSLYGCRHARAAAQWIKDGSASPMETKLMLLLSLPSRYGGFGFKDLEFNFRVNPGSSRGRIEQHYFKIDIAFPSRRVGIEFNGEAFHQDTAKDWTRINALESLGWHIIVIDKSQLYSAVRMEKAAHQIAALLGTRVQNRRNWEEKASELRRDLGLQR